MKLTLRKNLNTKSLVLKHNIVLEATMLLEGREGVLETEKDIYLMIAMVNVLVEEDLLQMCNDDKRDLSTIIVEDIEPFFEQIISQDEYNTLYLDCKKILLNRCKEIWDNQHSIIGVLDAILTSLSTITDDDKKEVLEATGKIAKQAYDDRTKKLEQSTKQTNDKLQELIEKYQQPIKEKIEDENKKNEE